MALFIAGLAIQQLVLGGIALASAISLYYGYQKAKTKSEEIILSNVLLKTKKQQPQYHKAWEKLQPYQGKVRRGVSSKGKLYYYQKDMLHGDVEVYKLKGSTGVHIGSVPMEGGILTKAAVVGRTIKL